MAKMVAAEYKAHDANERIKHADNEKGWEKRTLDLWLQHVRYNIYWTQIKLPIPWCLNLGRSTLGMDRQTTWRRHWLDSWLWMILQRVDFPVWLTNCRYLVELEWPELLLLAPWPGMDSYTDLLQTRRWVTRKNLCFMICQRSCRSLLLCVQYRKLQLQDSQKLMLWKDSVIKNKKGIRWWSWKDWRRQQINLCNVYLTDIYGTLIGAGR